MNRSFLPHLPMESRLQELLSTRLYLKITDNTRSMISVRRRNGAWVVRLHRMFLDAADDVLQALARFIRRPSLQHKKMLRDFIKDHEEKIRVRPVDTKPRTPHLRAKGKYVDLGGYFRALNEMYFGGRLGCAITWGTRKRGRRPRTIRLGSYCPNRKLIRIHPVLDSPEVPPFVIEDVLYHEMLHHELGMVRGNGRIFSHHRVFRAREKAFPHNARAREWIQENLSRLLTRARTG